MRSPEEFALDFIGDSDNPTSAMMRRVIAEAITKYGIEIKYQKAMRALESLTPGGSEYIGDPDRCVAHVKERQALQHKMILTYAKRAKDAERKLEAYINATNTD